MISPLRLGLLSLLSLGLYNYYWTWRNWKAFGARHGRKLSPLGRVLMGDIYTPFSLVPKMCVAAGRAGYTGYASPILGYIYFALSVAILILFRLEKSRPGVGFDDVGCLLVLLRWIPLLWVQRAVNFQQDRALGYRERARFSGGEIVASLLGPAFAVAILVMAVLLASAK